MILKDFPKKHLDISDLVSSRNERDFWFIAENNF